MKYCTRCGTQYVEGTQVCPGCGCLTPNAKENSQYDPAAAWWSLAFGIASFFGPIIFSIAAIVFANYSKRYTHGILCKKAKAGHSLGMFTMLIYPFLVLTVVAMLSSIFYWTVQ